MPPFKIKLFYNKYLYKYLKFGPKNIAEQKWDSLLVHDIWPSFQKDFLT